MTAYHRVLLVVESTLTGSWIFLAVFSPWLVPFDPLQPLIPIARLGTALPIFGGTAWLGTDLLGRDMLSRTISAARSDLALVGGTIVLTYIIGLYGRQTCPETVGDFLRRDVA